jgi:hypothetical protein
MWMTYYGIQTCTCSGVDPGLASQQGARHTAQSCCSVTPLADGVAARARRCSCVDMLCCMASEVL